MTNFPKTGRFIGFIKHILFVTPGFPADEQDTQCIPALWMYANELAKSGVKVSIIALQYPFKSARYQWKGIEVYPLNGANKKWKQLFLERRLVAIAKKIHNENSVDVIHSFWLHRATTLSEKVASALNLPMIATAMGQEMRHPGKGFEKWKKVHFPIVALSEFQSDALKKHGVIPSKIIPWGVPDTRESEKEIDLICVGSIIPLKNVEYFIDLCDELKQISSDFRAVIVGDGPAKKVMESLVDLRELNNQIRFTGALDYDQTQRLIAQSRILIHASEFEGFGMTIIEALAARTHVLATPVGIAKSLEIPHLIGDSELDAAMIQMLLKVDLPETELFSIAETVNAYQAIYASVSREKEIDS